eukprot:4324169-Amphidinium_carterae.1
MKEVEAQGVVSGYYVAGASSLGPRERKYACVAAFAARLPEIFSDSLLADERLLAQLSELESDLNEELSLLESIPMRVWSILSEVIHTPADEIQSDCIRAAQVAWAFIDWRVLRVVRQPPWDIVVAQDPSAELRWLAQRPLPPDEPTTAKIYHLLKAGYDMNKILEALTFDERVLMDIGFG